MTPAQAHLYLYPDLVARAETDPFISAILLVLRQAGIASVLHDDSEAELAAAPRRPGYALFRMIDPPHPNGLTFRRTYLPRFYRIETHGRRWDWPVARARFEPAQVNPAKAARFYANHGRRLFKGAQPQRKGHIFVPLQGRLLEHRSFQHAAPLRMLQDVLELTDRPVIATLHPSEPPSAAERAALERLSHPRLTVQRGGSMQALLECDFVVTQNSALALHGYFIGKPAVLYGGSDFHHIALKPAQIGVERALAQAPDHTPDFAAYLWWFFRDHALDVSRPNAQQAVAEALRRHGWPV